MDPGDTFLHESRGGLSTGDHETYMLLNLQLMGVDFSKVEREQKIQLGKGCFDRDNAKAFFFIMFHLLEVLCDEDDFKQFLGLYPPRTQKDTREFKETSLTLLSKLEKQRRIPQNFISGRSIMDSCKGQRLIIFFRFLSEFALRAHFMSHFPKENINIYNLNPMAAQLPKNDNQIQEISELYSAFSTDKSISTDEKTINSTVYQLQLQLMLEMKRFKKIKGKYGSFIEQINQSAETLTKSFQEERNRNIELRNKLSELTAQIPKQLLSQNRGLDRIQQIDLVEQTFADLQEVSSQINKENLVQKLEDFQDDLKFESQVNTITKEHLGLRTSKYVHLNEIYAKFLDCLKQQDQTIFNISMEHNYGSKDKEKSILQNLRDLKKQSQEEVAALESLLQKARSG